MTPVGHAAVGYVCGALCRSRRAAGLVGGMWPDIDLILTIFAPYNEVHRTFTHSIFFVGVSAFLLYVALYRDKLAAAAFFLGGISHCLIDSMMDGSADNGIGVALYWPLSSQMVSYYNFFDPSQSVSANNPLAYVAYLAPLLCVEATLAALAVFLELRRRRSRRPQRIALAR